MGSEFSIIAWVVQVQRVKLCRHVGVFRGGGGGRRGRGRGRRGRRPDMISRKNIQQKYCTFSPNSPVWLCDPRVHVVAVIQRGSLDEVLGVIPPHGGNVLVVHLEQIQGTLISRKILNIILLTVFNTCCVSSSVKHFSSFAGHSRARRERERHRRDLEI